MKERTGDLARDAKAWTDSTDAEVDGRKRTAAERRRRKRKKEEDEGEGVAKQKNGM